MEDIDNPEIACVFNSDEVAERVESEMQRKKLSESVVPIICGKCGCSTQRSLDRRRKDTHRYICENPHCHEVYHISEEAMIQMIGNLMGGASVTVNSQPDLDSLSEIQRLEREIARAIEYYDGGFSEIEAM